MVSAHAHKILSNIALVAVLLTAALVSIDSVFAQRPGGRGSGGGPGGGRPPTLVALAPAFEGILAPQRDDHGIVFFKELSEVATEVSGKVTEVVFEEGQRVTEGQVLVRLDDALLKKELGASRATAERYKSELEDSKVRFERAKMLLEDEVTTPQQYDMLRFEVESDTHQLASMRAEVGRIETLLDKHTIRAPFDGIVVERRTERGEWKGIGQVVAVIALENIFDVIVDVPEEQLRWIVEDSEVALRSVDNRKFHGRVVTILPRGDIVTGLFPVKIRVEARDLYEGMSLMVSLPDGEKQECLFVPRDAVISRIDGSYVVFTLRNMTTVIHQVEVLGYQGMNAAVSGPTIRGDNLQFIVKGHERLRGGDKVQLTEDQPAGPRTAAADG